MKRIFITKRVKRPPSEPSPASNTVAPVAARGRTVAEELAICPVVVVPGVRDGVVEVSARFVGGQRPIVCQIDGEWMSHEELESFIGSIRTFVETHDPARQKAVVRSRLSVV